MDAKALSVHNSKEFPHLLTGLHVSEFMKLKQNVPIIPDEIENLNLNDLNISETLFCSYCNTGFIDQKQQRQHYKLDWHRYNLKQHIAQRKTVSEEKFAQLADDVSSISGSDTESETEDLSSTDVESAKDKEDERLNHLIARKSRILFNNSTGQVISLHRSLLLNKKEETSTDEHLVKAVHNLVVKTTWLIIMLGGGHFAAVIFKDGEPILHKTFHSYTVRAKQGGSQNTKDNKGAASKSAGASLRRYNEQSLQQHVQDLMKNWGPDIVKCDLIFYRAVGRGNSSVLFGGSNPPLLRGDPRLRTVPITTRRPTFNEVKRVYSLLTTAFIYDSSENFRIKFSSPKRDKGKENVEKIEEKEVKEKSPRKIDRAKERPSPVRELPEIVQNLARSPSESENDGSVHMEISHELVSRIDDLQEFEDTVPLQMKKQRPRKKKKPAPPDPTEKMSDEQIIFWKKLHGACELEDFTLLKETVENSLGSLSKEDYSCIINQKNIEGQTVLHKMAAKAKGNFIRLLLLYGADPCIKDKKSQTPYDVCCDKETRNIFRRFMGEFPDLYDYSKSHIPSAITDSIEAEIAERKKASRKLKRQKEKERKAVLEVKKQEEDEKNRFLHLSDREKRALAAERRLLANSIDKKVVLARCFMCAEDITGKVPFEYDMNRFCSMPCLKAHRINSRKPL